jgi:transcriptional regulator with XRE-family HTH domain
MKTPLAKRIKQKREEAGLFQRELGKRVKISKQQIWRYENGHDTPTVKVLKRMCEVFNCSDSWLLHGKEWQCKSCKEKG